MGGVVLAGTVLAAAVIAVFVGVYFVVERPEQLRGRLEAYAGLEQQNRFSPGMERRRTPLLQLLGRLLGGRALSERVALRLAQANLRFTPAEFVAGTLGAGAVGMLLGYALQRQLVSAIACGAIGFVLPLLWLERRRQKRIRAFHDQLLDVLVLIVGALRSGHGLLNALDLVSAEMGAPAGEEFKRVVAEVGFGLSQSEALNNLVRRMENDDLQLMVTSINVSHEVGGSLSVVLDKIADTIRNRIRLHGEIRVLTTQQRLTSYVLVSIPFVIVATMAVLSPEYILPLFKPPWIIIPIIAFALEVVGFFLAQRLARIEV